MGRITSGISQIGGKFRLLNTILTQIPYHEFYLEPFLGSSIVLLNKPRCRYECGNDLNSELINYLLTIRQYPKEFDELKQGVFGLVSQEICNRIVRGELVPRNNIERAYFYYYLNKLTFGGGIWMVRKNPPYKGIQPNAASEQEIDKAKKEYEWKTKGYIGLIDNQTMSREGYGRVDSKVVKNAKASYRGVLLPTVCKGKSVEEAKSSYKGINPKTTRPYLNNDCGLLSPIQPEAIKRLRYVNLTTYPFQKVYKMFYEAFHVRKGLGEECFLYIDRPYPGTEKYYKSGFGKEEHEILNNIVLESPFHILESLGGKCEEIIDLYKEAGLRVKEVSVKYSTDANSQKKSKEFLIANYNINKLPKMIIKLKKKKIDSNNSRLGEWL